LLVETDCSLCEAAVGSGVAIASPGPGVGVGVDADDGTDFLAFANLPNPSEPSGLACTDFLIFWLGSCPSGAMFNTTLCLSSPASAKLGRGAGLSGSTHRSRNVLGFAEASADFVELSVVAVFDPETNGLETLERVGLELVLMMASLPVNRLPFFATHQYRNSAHDYMIVSPRTIFEGSNTNTSQCMHANSSRGLLPTRVLLSRKDDQRFAKKKETVSLSTGASVVRVGANV